ncbi:hypothetical protein [Pseudomonas sp. O39]|uniref:hypothetical protein n=1 Tax=Pseudomonas sp. O39 TaxID=3379130 RepID=UPI00387B070F
MTGQTINGVPRELLELAMLELTDSFSWAGELRALLDAKPETVAGHHPACRAVNDYKPRVQPRLQASRRAQGEPVAWMDPRSPEMHATISNEVTQHSLKIGGAPTAAVNGYSIPLYTEQPARVAVASLEVVGRQCFPSEAMKAVPGYRKKPWVDGDINQVQSEPGFYRVEPLVRLSDVIGLNAKSR